MPAPNEHLIHHLESALGANPHMRGQSLRIEHKAGRVVVRGRVRSYYQKQMAQESLLRIEGVDELDNEVEVHWA